MSERMYMVQIGYGTRLVVPAEMLTLLPKCRVVESCYRTVNGRKYTNVLYYAPECDIEIKLVDPATILDAEPPKDPPDDPPAPAAIVDGVIKAPPEDGSAGVQAARDLVAEAGDFFMLSAGRE